MSNFSYRTKDYNASSSCKVFPTRPGSVARGIYEVKYFLKNWVCIIYWNKSKVRIGGHCICFQAKEIRYQKRQGTGEKHMYKQDLYKIISTCFNK